MAAVAERAILGMFAAAPRHSFGLGQIHLFRGKAGAFVRAVTKRLAFGLATGAEIERAGLHRQDKRRFFGDNGFTHGSLLTPGGAGCKTNLLPDNGFHAPKKFL